MDQMPGQFPPPPDSGSPLPYSRMPGGRFPLDANGVFSLTFSLYRFRRRTFVAIALAILIPAVLVQAAVEFITADAFTTLALQMQVLARGGIPDIPQNVVPLVALSLIASAFYAIATSVAQTGVTKAAMETYSARQPDASDSVGFGLRKVVTLSAVYLVSIAASFAVIFFGLVLASFAFVLGPLGVFLGLIVIVSAVAALLFLSVRWSLVIPVVAFEGRGALAALGRSWRLASGASWRVLGYVLAFALLLFVLGLAIAFVIGLLLTVALAATRSPIDVQSLSPIVSLGGALLIALLVPIPAIGMMLLYLDLRFRQGENVPQPGGAAESTEQPPGPPTF